MKSIVIAAACAGGVLALAANAPADTGAAPPAPPAFSPCTACHSVEPGRKTFGPSLAGVAGRKAASLPGYAYSPALRTSGLTWDARSLDKWLASPQKAVPGTRMPFPGIADPAKRRQVVDYLMTLR
ncbi:cytochrome c [Novosphingobium sp. CF614]|uniref:c-type cytochrome n=1 Tax=Novosphingobium sp. CF614 TaxID=1884364 RepID=UPI0008EDDD6E|nr:c-type cytochrome [Novosphingobium sp. CF614]SFG09948.1 cytochrome c [Novosphingobium sp. CF614]